MEFRSAAKPGFTSIAALAATGMIALVRLATTEPGPRASCGNRGSTHPRRAHARCTCLACGSGYRDPQDAGQLRNLTRTFCSAFLQWTACRAVVACSCRVNVTNVEAGLAFYRDALGHALIWRTNTAAGLRMAESSSEIVSGPNDRNSKPISRFAPPIRRPMQWLGLEGTSPSLHRPGRQQRRSRALAVVHSPRD